MQPHSLRIDIIFVRQKNGTILLLDILAEPALGVARVSHKPRGEIKPTKSLLLTAVTKVMTHRLLLHHRIRYVYYNIQSPWKY